MKKNFEKICAAALALCLVALVMPLRAQEWSSAKAYFGKEEMPDMLQWLPAYPAPDSDAFAYDISRYKWGKEQRGDAERAAMAVRQADYSMKMVCEEYGPAMGIELSEEHTPEICRLLVDALYTCNNIAKLPKAHYNRTRPFVYFGETSLTPDDEVFLRGNGSYPSGHTILGWSAALLLAEINPAAADSLMDVGYKVGESRVIAGVHWQSDVDAGRLAASVAVAKLHTSRRFLLQMERAREEFLRLKGAAN